MVQASPFAIIVFCWTYRHDSWAAGFRPNADNPDFGSRISRYRLSNRQVFGVSSPCPTALSSTASPISSAPSSSSSSASISTAPAASGSWTERYSSLVAFKQVHGHTRVPKRYKENPALGRWVSKQRQQFRSYQLGVKPCSLNEQRIQLLDQIDFCWDASAVRQPPVDSTKRYKEEEGDMMLNNHHQISPTSDTSSSPDQQWWARFEELKRIVVDNDNNQQVESSSSAWNGEKTHAIARNSSLGRWLQRQRQQYATAAAAAAAARSSPGASPDAAAGSIPSSQQQQQQQQQQQHLLLEPNQLKALQQLDPDWWMPPREWQWERRYRQLLEYRRQYGHCCIPISYADNPALAHWVSNQRKQYNLLRQGKRSDLTARRLQRLEQVGFVWNRWEYEFTKKSADPK